MKSTFSLKGLDELEKALKEKATMQDVKDVVKMNGAEMQAKAMRNAPVDTGALKRYIMISIFDGGFTSRVNSLMNYAPYVEYGTRFMNAKPFLKPAFNQQKIQFRNDLNRLMK